MNEEDFSITYENNIFYCTKNNTKWISVDGKKWYGDEKRITELEAQIEKMKCGQNCKHSYLYQEDRKCKFTYCDCINCKDKWELRR